jgi:predicted MFS family arabinose efflux permease
LISKNIILENTGLVTLVIITVLSIPAFLTGEGAEETVEDLQGVSEYYLEQHEDLAEIAIWLMVTTGLLALVTYIRVKVKNTRNALLKIITVMLASGTFGVMTVVGNYGGKIRHSEIRDNTTIQTDRNESQGSHDNNRNMGNEMD